MNIQNKKTELVIFAIKIASYMFLSFPFYKISQILGCITVLSCSIWVNKRNGRLSFDAGRSKNTTDFFLFAYLDTHTLDTELCKLTRKKKKKLLKNGQHFGKIERLITLVIYTKWLMFDSRKHMNIYCFFLLNLE